MRRLLLALFLAVPPLSLGAQRPPNIVLIMADDMGFSDIGCYGAEIIQTPNLDRLATQGLRFTAFYNNAKCTTTRASLLTGLYPRNGGRGIEQLLTPNMLTLGEAMRHAGYHTSISGKWHNGSAPGTRPCDRGFDESYGLWDGGCNYFNPNQRDPEFKGGRVRFFGHNEYRITEFPDDFFTTDAFADHAVKTITRFTSDPSDKPFFAYIPFTAPHYPLHALPEDIAAYKGKFNDGWDVLQKRRHARTVELGLVDPNWKLPAPDREVEPWEDAPHKDWQNLRMETYAAMVTHMDRAIGRVLDTLDELGVADNTLVLFLSDNGSCAETPGGATNTEHVPGPREFYSHVGPGWAYAQNAPYRRYKSRMHEGGIATPLIARWPKIIEPGTLTNQVGHIIDFLPTFLDLANTPYPKSYQNNQLIPTEGKSLDPIFRSGTRQAHDHLYWYFNGSRAIRHGDWKLAWDPKVKKWELYNMKSDRTETNDLAAHHPEIAQSLAERWKSWASSTGVKLK